MAPLPPSPSSSPCGPNPKARAGDLPAGRTRRDHRHRHHLLDGARQTASFTGVEGWYDKIFHYAVPVGAMLGFFLFRPRTRFARSDLVFLAWPVAWLAYTLVRGAVSHPRFQIEKGKYADVPYDFLDADKYGAGRVSVSALAVTVLMFGIAAVYERFSNRTLDETA